MKNNDIYILLILLSIIINQSLAQEPPQRELRCSLLTQTVYSVPINTDMDSITDIDSIKMITNDILEYVTYVINQENELTITCNYPELPRYENDYQYEIGKAVSNKEGTIIYDHDNNEISSNLNTTIDSSFILSNTETYGVDNEMFSVDITTVESILSQAGFQSFIQDSLITALSENFEMEIDYRNLVFEVRYFIDSILEISNSTYYKIVDEYIIPFKEVSIHYDTLPGCGFRYQISEIKNYLTYTLLDNNNIIIDVVNDLDNAINENVNIYQYEEVRQLESDIKVYPNPASNLITIIFPFYLNKNINVDIINPLGSVLIYIKNINEKQVTLDIASLKKGIYLIRCYNKDKTISTRFVKQ